MLSDPKTFSVLVAGLLDEPPKAMGSSKAPPRRLRHREGRMSAERLELLLSMGLTDRDLDYMGPKQRAMVEDVLDANLRKVAAA